MIGKWNGSVVLTYIGAVIALTGIFIAMTSGNVRYAMACLMVAGICDLFDGAVARKFKRTEEEKRFGVELDSLVDVIDFLALPVAIFIAAGLDQIYALIVFAVYIICGIARLAYFNSVTADTEGPVRYYTGLPVTYTALIFPFVYLLSYAVDQGVFLCILTVSIIIVSVLFILKIKIAKPKGIAYGIFGILAVSMIVLYLGFLK